ncbi:MAG: LamG domain-containing protein [Bacteroidetes bacterium]|nr:LamG domain-containing protein [Bacteroidota bacterium]
MKYSTKVFVILIGFVFINSILFAQAPTNGLVAYYPFTGNVNDASGNGRNGTIVGGVTPSTDRYGNAGQAYTFNGSNGCITAGWEILTGNAARTMSVWFKMTSLQVSPQYMLSWGALTTNNSSLIGTYTDNANTPKFLGFFATTFNSLYVTDDLQYYDNRWHLMTFTHDGSTSKLFLDGALQNTATNVTLNTFSTPLAIGRLTFGPYYFSGSLDEVRVYNRALTATEVQQMYSAEVPTNLQTDVIKLGTNKLIHTTGIANMFVGTNAGINTTGANNTFLGNTAGLGITSGQGNVFLGSNANGFGANMGTLQRSGAIGYNARVSINDAIVLGDFQNNNLKVGIGVHDPQHRLDVKGVINMRAAFNQPALKINGHDFLELGSQGEFIVSNFKMKYQSENQWADRVFKKGYVLMPLAQLDEYIRERGHLPGIPTASEVVEKGISAQEMTAKLLEKVEELTRYVIELKKENDTLKKNYKELMERIPTNK